MKPIEPIQQAFGKGKPAFMPYFSFGYPNFETSLEIMAACAENGADLMELGIPFSDPLADGPTIQHSTQVALEQGVTVQKCLEGVRLLRARGIEIPLILMGYYNPALAYGLEKLVQEAASAGANGFIIPDLPPQEGEEMERLCRAEGLALVYMLSPNSTSARIEMVSQHASGFTYLVAVTGITGERTSLPPDLAGFIRRVRSKAQTPLAVGFGISTPEQARAVGQAADGVIVGSALIRRVGQALEQGDNPALAAGQFVASLAGALQHGETD